MFDLRAIRDNPASYDQGWARRGLSGQTSQILALDANRRALQTEIQTLLARRNELSRLIGEAKKRKDEATAAICMDEVADIKQTLPGLETEEVRIGVELDAILAALPNLPAVDAPDGPDESGNVEIRRVGAPRVFDQPKDHVALGEALG